MGHRGDVAGRVGYAIDAVSKMVRDSSGRGRDDRKAACHRFEHDKAQRFGERREEEGVGACIETREHRLAVEIAEEGDVFRGVVGAQGIGSRPRTGDYEMHRTLRELGPGEREGGKNALHSLLGGQAADMEEDDAVAPAVCCAQRLAAMSRMKGLDVNAAAPDFDVCHAHGQKVGLRRRRWCVGPNSAPMKSREMSAHRRAQPGHAVGFGVAREVGVIRGHDAQAAPPGKGLAEPTDGKLRGAVDQVGGEVVHHAREREGIRHGEPDVRIEGEGRAG